MLKDALDRIREVALSLPEDDPDRLEMLDTEGDFSDLMEWAIRKRNDYLSLADGAKALSETYAARKKAFENRADSMKDIIAVIMNTAGETKYQGAAATVSIRAVSPKPIISDESLIPEDYWRVKKEINKTSINEAVKSGATIPGVTLDNGGVTISIRSK